MPAATAIRSARPSPLIQLASDATAGVFPSDGHVSASAQDDRRHRAEAVRSCLRLSAPAPVAATGLLIRFTDDGENAGHVRQIVRDDGDRWVTLSEPLPVAPAGAYVLVVDVRGRAELLVRAELPANVEADVVPVWLVVGAARQLVPCIGSPFTLRAAIAPAPGEDGR